MVLEEGVSYHRRLLVCQTAEPLNIDQQPLSSYHPDLMPVEPLWAWLREAVTYHVGYETQEPLLTPIARFQPDINANPTEIAERLWIQTQLDPREEPLQFSR